MRSHPFPSLSVFVASLLAATPALAQSDPLSGGATAIRAALGLAVIVALILLCGWVAKRTGVASRASAGMPARMVGSMTLGPRERIIVLQVEETWLIVGVTAGGMQTLHSLPAPPPTASTAREAAPGWREALQRATGRRWGA